MKSITFDQVKTMLKSMSIAIYKCIAKAQESANQAKESANQAKESANQAQSKTDSKMDIENPTGTGYFTMNWESDTTAVPGDRSHSCNEGRAVGRLAHATGQGIARGIESHAEGNSEAEGYKSHAEGNGTKSIGSNSHTEGTFTETVGDTSHAEGSNTIAQYKNQHVQGVFNDPGPKRTDDINMETSDGLYAHVVGNGYVDADYKIVRKNAHTIDWNGNAWFQGEVYVGGKDQNNGAMKLVKNGDEALTLKSPDGSLFTITVGNDGTLSAAKAS